MTLVVGAASDRGRVRESNEDNVSALVPPRVGAGVDAVLAVADGMGGHRAGEVASQMVLDFLEGVFARNDRARDDEAVADLARSLRDAILQAHRLVRTAAERDEQYRGMGTTLTAVVLAKGQLFLGHVGDSRAYLVRSSAVRQLSTDHSWVAEQVRAGSLSVAQARSHPGRNVLTQAVGSGDVIEVNTTSIPLQVGDVLVLCTDGLSNLVGDEEIRDVVLTYGQPRVAAERLVAMANQRGSPDNVTALVARVLDGGDRAPSEEDTEQLSRASWRRHSEWLAYLAAAIVAALAFLLLRTGPSANPVALFEWLGHLLALGPHP